MRKGIWGFALVAIVLLMASCSSESEYANAIPKDAAMVMSFDFKTMAEKSGINGKGGEKVVAKLTDALKSGLEGEAYKTAEKIIQNPSESGLSFTDRCICSSLLILMLLLYWRKWMMKVKWKLCWRH